MAANGKINFLIDLQEILSSGSTRPANADLPCKLPNLIQAFTEGTGAKQINKVAYDSRTLSAAAYSYDFTSLATLSGAVGFAHVRGIALLNDGANPVTIGNGLTPLAYFFGAAAHTFVLEPGGGTGSPGIFLATKSIGANGWLVDASNKLLKVDPGANNVPVRLIAWGD